MLGSQIKSRILKQHPEFKESELGYPNFAAFVRDIKGVASEFRTNADFTAVPAQYSEALKEGAEEPLRIRKDFWDAFVTFPVPGQFRAYDPANDQIVRGTADNIPAGVFTIVPITAEEQLQWRRDFIKELGEDSSLSEVLPQLQPSGGLRAFSQAIDSRPALKRRWYSMLAQRVAERIRQWARSHDVGDTLWVLSAPSQLQEPEDVRLKIYAVLDRIPVERLLDLSLPVRWLLDVPPTSQDLEK